MKLLIGALVLAVATPAFAEDASGQWAFDGDIEGHGFKLYCTLEQDGAILTGLCHDDTPNGKGHRLVSGSIHGDELSFTFKRTYLVLKVTAGFKGTLSGSTITGKATAVGYSGPFTATRIGPPPAS